MEVVLAVIHLHAASSDSVYDRLLGQFKNAFYAFYAFRPHFLS
jgi:hypothetical protein